MVAFDFETQQSVPMPEEWRTRLEEYLVRSERE
jgi:acyl-CoA thioesterase FadM